jgi:Flp pilus assembly protein TadB
MRAGDQPTGRARGGGQTVARLRMQVAAGHPLDVPAGMSADARACLQVADGVGAPLLPVLDALADAEEQRARVARQVATAAAPARTVAVVLVCLPLVAVPLLARVSGVDLLAFYRSGLGLVIGMIGVSLWAAGGAAVWLILRRGTDGAGTSVTVRALVPAAVIAIVLSPWLAIPAWLGARLVLRATPRPPHPDLPAVCDLVATGLSAGVSPAAALRLAADHVPALASDLRGLAWRLDLGRDRLDAGDAIPLAQVLADGLAVGGPLTPALRGLARDLRADRAAHAEAAALRLPARLTFPTSLLLLPATVLLIGAPVVASGLHAVSGA